TVTAESARGLAPRHTVASSCNCDRSLTTTKSHGCQLRDEGARRPASRIRSSASGAISRLANRRTLRREVIASQVSIGYHLSFAFQARRLMIADVPGRGRRRRRARRASADPLTHGTVIRCEYSLSVPPACSAKSWSGCWRAKARLARCRYRTCFWSTSYRSGPSDHARSRFVRWWPTRRGRELRATCCPGDPR